MTTEVLRNMIYAGVPGAPGAPLRRARRGALPPGHLPGAGVGGGHHPPAARGAPRVPLGHRLQRRGAGRVDLHGARAHRGGHRGAPARRAAEPLPRRRQALAGPAPAPDAGGRPPQPGGRPPRRRGAARAGRYVRGRPRRRFFTPRRLEVIDRLQDESMLPAITFIFSRNACDDARDAVPRRGPPAHDPRRAGADPRDRRRAHRGPGRRRPRRARLRPVPRRARGGRRRAPCRDGPPLQGGGRGLLRRGPHEGRVRHGDARPRREHAGPFGRHRAPHEVRGRAPRAAHARGVHAADRTGGPTRDRRRRATRIVLWSPFVPFEQVAALASSRTYALRSAFRPTYNMAANLVRRYEPEEAHHLLNLSFAQYQADRAVVRLEARIERQGQRLDAAPGRGRLRAR